MSALISCIQGVILDMDGTLIDSMGIWHEIDIRFFEENGLTLPEGLSEKVAKMSIQEWAEYFVQQYVPALTPAAVIRRVEEMAAEYYAHTIPLKPYAAEFLDMLDTAGIPYGICTATYRSSAQAVLHRLGLADRMQFLLTGDDFPGGKSDSRMYRTAQALLGTETAATLIVEDALHCIRLAAECGYPVAAVYDPSTPDSAWTESKQLAAVHGNDLGEILEKLQKNGGQHL